MYLRSGLICRPVTVILLCFCMTAFWSCQKELSYELPTGTTPGTGGGSSGSAVFLLVPSGSNCSDATPSGTFQAGTVLTASSFLTVTVNVTTQGSWTFSTATVNGFVFAGAGTFTATGNQSITLIAAGTPTAAGSSVFNLAIGSSSCSITVPVTAAGPGGGNPTADFYYKATIGGVAYTQIVTASNGYIAGSGLSGSDDVAFGGGINYDNPPLPPGSTEMGVDKGLMHHYLTASDAQFKAFFPVGACAYAPAGPSEFTGDGVVVFWTDPSGNYWSSQSATSDQTGSSFTIVSVTDARDITGTLYIKVKMQFSCKLYNVNTGAVKQLTNGEMVTYFGKI